MVDAISLSERIRQITEDWFLREPAFFHILCTHELCPNPNIQVPIRTGKGRIEYNEDKLAQLTTDALEEHFKIEMVRLFLKHPYERQPLGSRADALHGGSDFVIEPFYTPHWVKMLSPQLFKLPRNQSFEWYVEELNDLLRDFVLLSGTQPYSLDSDGSGARDGSGEDTQRLKMIEAKASSTDDSSLSEKFQQERDRVDQLPSQYEYTFNEASKEYTELWEEDEERSQEINNLINGTIPSWGSIPNQLVEIIKTATIGKVDYRRVLSGFRKSIISSNRKLTRMKPNRKYGWTYMGCTFESSTKLLVAIDVSGSVSSRTISYFLNVIRRFFKYCVSEIDIIQFDANVKSEVLTLKESAQRLIKGFRVEGRGGTDFQQVVNYLKAHNYYDGLIIFTDGYAPQPTIDFKCRAKVLWVLESDECYQKCSARLRPIGRVCTMSL